MARHAQITQNNKFAISLQYLKKELSDEVDFLHADKHESLLQIDSMILMGMVKDSQSSKIANLQCLYNISKNEVKDQVDFSHADKFQSFLKAYFNFLGVKFPTRSILLKMGKMKHYPITQSNKFAISLQYLQKEVRNGGHFWHADKRQSFCKLVLSFLMEMTRHVQNTQNRTLGIFLQYIKKNCRNAFVFYCDATHSDISRRSSHVRCYLFFALN